MKKEIILALTFMIMVTITISAVSAEGWDIFNSNTNSENTDDVFIVGFDSNFPPFSYIDDDGNYTGFDLKLAQEICKRNNWTFKAQPLIDWNTKDAEVNSGGVDCVWSAFTLEDRGNEYTLSNGYFNNSKVAVVRADSGINTLNDLKGKNIEIHEGGSALDTLEKQNSTLKNSFNDVTQFRDYDTAFVDLQSNATDAVIGDLWMINYYIVKNNKTSLKILDEPISHETYGIGFKKGNTELRDQVQQTLDEMFKDGTVESIAQDYKEYNLTDGLIPPK